MDAVSYAHSAKQAQRIKKFIENPDSTSGILTQPSVIQTGETVNIPAGRTAILANTQIDGTITLDGTIFIPSGTTTNYIDDQLALKANIVYVDNQVASSVPSGTVITIAKNTAPTGYLKANGALISRTTYASLFDAIGTAFGVGDGSTTFALPDLRGYFQRAWDDGRGIDTGRIFGSLQQDSYLNHSHTASSESAGSHTHSSTSVPSSGNKVSSSVTGTSATYGVVNNTINATIGSGGAHTHTITVGSSTTGSTETRPKNIALLYCIKY